MTTSTKYCWALGCSSRSACKVGHGDGKNRLVVPLCNRHFGQWPEVCLKPLAERGLGPTDRPQPLSRMHLKTEGLSPMTTAPTAFIITAPPTPEELDTSGLGCRVAGCENATRTRGLCDNHYRQALRRDLIDDWGAPPKGRGGWPNQKPGIRIKAAPEPGQRDPSKTACIVTGCDEDQRNRGLCSKHYTQAFRAGVLEEWGLPAKGPGGRPLEAVETPAASSAEEVPAVAVLRPSERNQTHPDDQLDADQLREKLDAEAAEVEKQVTQLEVKAASIVSRKRALRTRQCLSELIRVDDFDTMPLWMQDIFEHNLAVARQRIEEELLQAAAYGPRPARGGAA